MASLRRSAPASEPADAGWAYWRAAVDGVVELGTVRGREVALPTHFHAEDQITFVVTGRRRFLVGGELIALAAGQGALIPAGIAHRSFAEPSGAACFNAYLPAGEYAVTAMMRDIEHVWHEAGHIHPEGLAAVARAHRRRARKGTPPSDAVPADATCREPVGRVAARAGLSREGFSRAFATPGATACRPMPSGS